jgi:hypothetical protein
VSPASKAHVNMQCIAFGERCVFNQQPQHTLLLLHLCTRIAPETWEIGGEGHQFGVLGVGYNAGVSGLCLLVCFLCRGERTEPSVPVRFK